MNDLVTHLAVAFGTVAGCFLAFVFGCGLLGFLTFHVFRLGLRLPSLLLSLPGRLIRMHVTTHAAVQPRVTDHVTRVEQQQKHDLHAMAFGIADLDRMAPDERHRLRRS